MCNKESILQVTVLRFDCTMEFLTNTDITSRFSSFGEEIARRVSEGDTTSFIYILPTGAWARQEIMRVVEIASPRTVILPHIYSMQEFIGKLHSALAPYKRVISSGESAVLVEIAIRELFKEGTLRYYQEREGRALPLPQATFEELVAAIATLKERGITTTMLADDVARKERLVEGAYESTELRRARDLASIYQRYQEKLGDTLIDEYGQYLRLVEQCALGDGSVASEEFLSLVRRTFPQAQDIFVDVFIRMAEPARLIVNACGSSMSVCYAVDTEPNNPDLFALQQQFITKQKTSGLTHTLKSKGETSDPFTHVLRRNLFRRSGKHDPLHTSHIVASTSVSTRKELESAAGKIKQLLLGGVCAPDEICVAMYRQDELSALASEVFAEYGIPINSTERRKVATAPIFSAIDSLFRLTDKHLRATELLRLLHSPYFSIRHPDTEPIDSQNLIEVISTFQLTSGAKKWSGEMTEHLLRVKTIREAEDEFQERANKRSITCLERGIKDITLIEDILATFDCELSPKAYFSLLKDILTNFSLKEQLFRSSDALISVNEFEQDTRSYAALMELLEEVQTLCRALDKGEKTHKAEYYGERIRTAALKKRYATRAEPGSGVMLTSFDQTAGYEYQHLFLIGLNDASLPSVHSTSITLPNEYQTSEDEHLTSERFAFYQILTRAKGKLYLSWQRASAGSASEKLPSVFVEALKRVVAINIIDEVTTTESIFSPREFAQIAATNSAVHLVENAQISEREADWVQNVLPVSAALAHIRINGIACEYTGYLRPEQLPPQLRERLNKMRENTYSVSQLESYARCPFQYFSRYLMNIRDTTSIEIEEGMESYERGNLLHYQLEKMLSAIRDRGIDFRTLTLEEFKEYDPYNGETTDHLSEAGTRHPFWRVDLDALYDPPEGRAGVLQKFLEAEKSNPNIVTKPILFEKKFEDQVIKDKTVGDDQRSFRLRGAIDRIDVDSGNTFFTVTDYKTSKGATKKDIENGVSLQLPLYLRVAEDILRTHLGSELQGVGAFYHTLTGTDTGKSPALLLRDYAERTYKSITNTTKVGIADSPEELDAMISTTIRYANDYIDGMTRGEFPLVREDGTAACKYCDYKRACRKNEAQEHGTLRKR